LLLLRARASLFWPADAAIFNRGEPLSRQHTGAGGGHGLSIPLARRHGRPGNMIMETSELGEKVVEQLSRCLADQFPILSLQNGSLDERPRRVGPVVVVALAGCEATTFFGTRRAMFFARSYPHPYLDCAIHSLRRAAPDPGSARGFPLRQTCDAVHSTPPPDFAQQKSLPRCFRWSRWVVCRHDT